MSGVSIKHSVGNFEAERGALCLHAGMGMLVAVDQRRNVNALAIARGRSAGLPVADLPDIAAHQASKLLAGDTKTALGIPDSLLPVDEPSA
ncbi:MAG: hypothetical protein ACOYIK_07675 [Coriobacteriales bacterium]